MTSTKPSHHGSPLRYPGGKAKLAPFFKALIRENDLLDCTYVEPFAGGGGVAVSLLLHGYVNDIILNDLSAPIYSFWLAVLNEPERFERDILETPLSVTEWERQREIFRSETSPSCYDLGFAAFYLNRTNHSGVLNGGMIGGYAQTSKYSLGARFNRAELAARVKRISRQRDKIRVTNLDAVNLLDGIEKYCRPSDTLLYIDPPYFAKGRDLYYDYYRPEDHGTLRDSVFSLPAESKWVVSYDDVTEIRALYSGANLLSYNLPYSVRNGRNGDEVIFLADALTAPSGWLAPAQESTGHCVDNNEATHIRSPAHELSEN